MSTRSTIIYSDNTGNHIWAETNEPVYWFDKFVGYNIYGVIDFNELKEVTMNQTGILLTFIKDTYFHHLFPDGLQLTHGFIIDFEVDSEGVSFGIKGDNTYFAKKLREVAAAKPL
jgi:hypothetical protein